MKSISQEPTAAVQAKIGARLQAMPGARSTCRVVTRSMETRTRPRVAKPQAVIQASTPLLPRKASSDSGGSGLTPASDGVQRKPE